MSLATVAWPIFGRFGFTAASQNVTLDLATRKEHSFSNGLGLHEEANVSTFAC